MESETKDLLNLYWQNGRQSSSMVQKYSHMQEISVAIHILAIYIVDLSSQIFGQISSFMLKYEGQKSLHQNGEQWFDRTINSVWQAF